MDAVMSKDYFSLQVDYSPARERDFNQIVTVEIVRLQLKRCHRRQTRCWEGLKGGLIQIGR